MVLFPPSNIKVYKTYQVNLVLLGFPYPSSGCGKFQKGGRASGPKIALMSVLRITVLEPDERTSAKQENWGLLILKNLGTVISS